jgi:hypothetical protein
MKTKNTLTKILKGIGTIVMIAGTLMVIATYLNRHSLFYDKGSNTLFEYLIPILAVLTGFIITKIANHFDKAGRS